MKQSLSFRKGDLSAVALVLLLAIGIASAFAAGGGMSAAKVLQIYHDGALIHELSLENNDVLTVKGDFICTITVQDGRAAITGSDCPGQDCVHSGWISSAGRSIVCLPNRVELRIAGASDVDFVVR